MAIRQTDAGSYFAIGFALGLFGSCLGLAVAPLVSREAVPAAVMGFVLGTALLLCLGILDVYLTGFDVFFQSDADPNSIESIPRITFDGSPTDEEGSPPVVLLAALGGAVLALLGIVVAAWLFLRPDQDDGDIDDVPT